MASGNNFLGYLASLFNPASAPANQPDIPADPKEQIRRWIQEIKDQLPLFDQTIARIRQELPGREGLLHQAEIHLQQLEREIQDSLKTNDRAHAGALAIERERQKKNVDSRRRSLQRAQASLDRAMDKRSRYLEAMTIQLKELQALLQEAATPELATRVQALASRAQAAGATSLAEKLLKEAEPEGDPPLPPDPQ